MQSLIHMVTEFAQALIDEGLRKGHVWALERVTQVRGADHEVVLGELQEEGAADAVVQEALAVLAQTDVLRPVADLARAPARHGHPHLPPHPLQHPLLPTLCLQQCKASQTPRRILWSQAVVVRMGKALDQLAYDQCMASC